MNLFQISKCREISSATLNNGIWLACLDVISQINFVSNAVLTDGLAAWHARAYDGTVMVKYLPRSRTSWWRHRMETFSALLALLALCVGNSRVTGEFPAQRPVTRSFDVSFDVRLDK